MKLHHSPRSPYVRKVMIFAHETGLAGQIECVRSLAATTQPNPDIMRDNPLSKIPTLVLEDGTSIFDSAVICEYLDGLHQGPKMFPSEPGARLTALKRQALGNGLLDILIFWRGEQMRAAEIQSEPHLKAFDVKTRAVLDALESDAPALDRDPFGIGQITIGVALSYLDFRFADDDWRQGRGQLDAWHAQFCGRASVGAVPVIDDA